MTLPFENDTSDITRKLAKRSIRADKRRNFFVILTISFVACLLVSLALYIYGGSYQTERYLRGRYQAAVIHVDPYKLEALLEDVAIEKIGQTARVTSLRVNKNILNITYRDAPELSLMSIELTDGHLPEDEDEIVIASSYLEKQGIEAALGQTISLDLGENVASEYTICGLTKDDDANSVYEALVSQSFLTAYYAGKKIPYEASVRMAGSDGMAMEELRQYILTSLAAHDIDESNIAFSSSYFKTLDTDTGNTIGILMVSLIIVVAGSTVIYSIFYISITGKIKEYGRLRVIGMTKRQVRRLVQKESRMLSSLSIPAGLIAGCLIGYALIPGGWHWPNTVKCVVAAVVLTKAAVYIATRKPVQLASSVSPIEAVRFTTTVNTEKVLQVKKLSRKITPHTLAKINFSRNRKMVVLTLFSLGFTGVFLMGVSTLLSSADPLHLALQSMGKHELVISISPDDRSFDSMVAAMDHLQQNNPLDGDFLNKLSENQVIKDVSISQSCTATVFFPDQVNVADMPYYEIVGLSKTYFDEYQDTFPGLDYDELVDNRGIIIDDSHKMVEKFGHHKFSVGDIIEIETSAGETVPFTVMAAVALNDKDYGGNNFFVPQESLPVIKPNTTNFNTKLLLHANLEDISKAEDYVYEVCGENQNLRIQSISEVIAFMKQNLKLYQSGMYGLVIFLGVFALINLVNTLMTNLISRQQEFGILQSIGLSDKQLSQMLQIECFYYVLAAITITLTIGTTAGYVLCRAFSQIGLLGKLNYTFPVLPILIFFAALVLIAIGYSILAIRYCKKQSLVERIKKGDIG